MKIKQEQKPLEYFERMLPLYDEYERSIRRIMGQRVNY